MASAVPGKERDMHRLPRSLAQAGDPCDPQNHMHGLYPKLGHIRVYEHQHGRPLLSAPVVATATGRPGAALPNMPHSSASKPPKIQGSGSIRSHGQCASGPLMTGSC